MVDNIGGLFEAIDYAKESANINFGGLTLVQYQTGSANSLYKFEVTMQEVLTSPLEKDISILQTLSQEHCWLIEPNIRVY